MVSRAATKKSQEVTAKGKSKAKSLARSLSLRTDARVLVQSPTKTTPVLDNNDAGPSQPQPQPCRDYAGFPQYTQDEDDDFYDEPPSPVPTEILNPGGPGCLPDVDMTQYRVGSRDFATNPPSPPPALAIPAVRDPYLMLAQYEMHLSHGQYETLENWYRTVENGKEFRFGREPTASTVAPSEHSDDELCRAPESSLRRAPTPEVIPTEDLRRTPIAGHLLRTLLTIGWVTMDEANARWLRKDFKALEDYDRVYKRSPDEDTTALQEAYAAAGWENVHLEERYPWIPALNLYDPSEWYETWGAVLRHKQLVAKRLWQEPSICIIKQPVFYVPDHDDPSGTSVHFRPGVHSYAQCWKKGKWTPGYRDRRSIYMAYARSREGLLLGLEKTKAMTKAAMANNGMIPDGWEKAYDDRKAREAAEKAAKDGVIEGQETEEDEEDLEEDEEEIEVVIERWKTRARHLKTAEEVGVMERDPKDLGHYPPELFYDLHSPSSKKARKKAEEEYKRRRNGEGRPLKKRRLTRELRKTQGGLPRGIRKDAIGLDAGMPFLDVEMVLEAQRKKAAAAEEKEREKEEKRRRRSTKRKFDENDAGNALAGPSPKRLAVEPSFVMPTSTHATTSRGTKRTATMAALDLDEPGDIVPPKRQGRTTKKRGQPVVAAERPLTRARQKELDALKKGKGRSRA
ncbi:hypothetical protein DL96DRAFT_1634499 [Flagelloscypha sp. PMI_526]|nr:hypothetical protein DL96DRAFT_1634499 [Flagelloscypha sp. PMI_526]